MKQKLKQIMYPDYSNFDNSRVTLGALDLEACILYLNCPRDEYYKDYKVFCDLMISQGYVRVFFHELTHYFQINTTINGMYISCLEDFQVIQVKQIIHLIDNIGFPIISNMITKHKTDEEPYAWYHLRKWYAAELLKSIFNCDPYRYNYLIQNTVFQDEQISDIFCEIDNEMRKVFCAASYQKSIQNNSMYLDEDLLYILNKGASPYENHARMAEFWWESKTKENPFVNNTNDLFEYSGWINAFAKRNAISDFQNFVACFLAICELSQFAPVLPGISSVKETSVYDLIPSYRMAKLIQLSHHITPIDGINDYNRYINELAEKANYTNVTELCEDILKNRFQKPGKSFWVDLFYESIQVRSENFSAFYNYGLWHPLALTVEPFSREFTKRFCPPIICYQDCNYSREKNSNIQNESFSIIIRNLFRKYVAAIMTGCCKYENGSILFPLPVHGTELEKQYVEYQTNIFIRQRFGNMPRLKVI